jgi:exodeoxyribonuclease V
MAKRKETKDPSIMSSNDFDFNEQQKYAIRSITAWYRQYRDGLALNPVYFLAGYAGTGKTSVAKTVAELCVPAHRIVYIAPTGKAASRLRQKGCKGAMTLHSFAYNVRGENEEGEPIFVEKGVLNESPLLVVCDEASMLGARDNRALLRHNIPVLALGDTGQVEPVKDAAAYTDANVDFMLTEIHRQAADSNIIRASMFVREGKRLPIREYDDVRVREGHPKDADLVEHSGEDGQIICARNDTRRYLNARVRAILGFSGAVPQIGEKIVCTSNQHGFGIMNGETSILLGYEEAPGYEREDDDDGLRVRVKSLTDGKERRVKFNTLSFSADEEVATEARKSAGGFDYGFALTIHKSQGSEWDNVLVIEESLRGQYAKLMYTAITRAAKRLTMYRV